MMRFAEVSPFVRLVWAKSGELPGHGLLAHLLDVAAVALAVLSRESPPSRDWIGDAFGLRHESALRWLAAMAGLHDFGKAIPGFQAKWVEGRVQDEGAGLLFRPAASLAQDRHDLASAGLLRSELPRRFPGAEWPRLVAQALGAHHGYFPNPNEIKKGTLGRRFPDHATAQLERLLAMGFRQADLKHILEPALELVRRYGVTFYDATYHATALAYGGVLVTGDQRYLEAAASAGNILALAAWPLGNAAYEISI